MQDRKWWVLAAMASCISMIFTDQTVLPVSLPTIQRELSVSEVELHWIVNAYLLALTAFVLSAGRLGDLIGHRRTFCTGLFIFVASSSLCGISASGPGLILFRYLQGIGGAFLIPSSGTLLISAFPAHQRGLAVGLYVSIGSIFLALGPLVGGMITEYMHWRYIFWLNLPIGLFGYILTMLIVPKTQPRKESFDLYSFLFFSLGITAFVVVLMEGPIWGWFSQYNLILLGLSVLFFALLYHSTKMAAHPLIDVSLFHRRSYSGAVLCGFLAQSITMVSIFWALYLQHILHFSPSQSGFIAIMANSPIMIAAPVAGWIMDRMGPKFPVCLGFIFISAALTWFNFHLNNAELAVLLPALILFGVGIPLIFTPCFTSAMVTVPENQRGVATGINTTSRQMASTVGMALFSGIFLQSQQTIFSEELLNNAHTSSLNPSKFEGLLSGTQTALSEVGTLSQETAHLVYEYFSDAYLVAFSRINWLALTFGVLGLIAAFLLLSRKRS